MALTKSPPKEEKPRVTPPQVAGPWLWAGNTPIPLTWFRSSSVYFHHLWPKWLMGISRLSTSDGWEVMYFQVRESHTNVEGFSSKKEGGATERMLGAESAGMQG